MKYGSIPHFATGISRLVVGTIYARHESRDASFALFDAALAAGINTFDLAHIYNRGQGHEVLGEWIRERDVRDRIVLFDKGCHHNKDGPQVRPEVIREQLRINLERLGLERGDLFVFHRDDPAVPVEPLVDELNRLRDEGRVQAWGASNWTVARIREFQDYAAAHDLQGFSLNNPNLSLATVNEPMWADAHTVTPDERAWHAETQFPLFAWSSQAGGWFFGVDSPDVQRVYANPENEARRERVRSMATEKGVSVAALVVAWALGEPYPVWALIGPRTPEELQDSLEAMTVRLTDDERAYLEHGG